METLQNVLYGNIWKNRQVDLREGGYGCKNEATTLYRALAYFPFTTIDIIIVIQCFKNQRYRYLKSKSIWLDLLLGICGLVCLSMIIFTKATQNTLMFIFNPCHITLVILIASFNLPVFKLFCR